MKLYSAIRYSRERPATLRSAATPSGPTSRSTNGISPFVRMQYILLAAIGCWVSLLPRLVDQIGGDADRVRQRVAHRRFSVDRFLALANPLFRRRTLDRDGVADVAEPVADRLVVSEQAPEIDIGFHVDVDRVERHVEQRGVGGDAGRDAPGERSHECLRRRGGAVDASEDVGVVGHDPEPARAGDEGLTERS